VPGSGAQHAAGQERGKAHIVCVNRKSAGSSGQQGAKARLLCLSRATAPGRTHKLPSPHHNRHAAEYRPQLLTLQPCAAAHMPAGLLLMLTLAKRCLLAIMHPSSNSYWLIAAPSGSSPISVGDSGRYPAYSQYSQHTNTANMVSDRWPCPTRSCWLRARTCQRQIRPRNQQDRSCP
jgi:hypothetical protein